MDPPLARRDSSELIFMDACNLFHLVNIVKESGQASDRFQAKHPKVLNRQYWAQRLAKQWLQCIYLCSPLPFELLGEITKPLNNR